MGNPSAYFIKCSNKGDRGYFCPLCLFFFYSRICLNTHTLKLRLLNLLTPKKSHIRLGLAIDNRDDMVYKKACFSSGVRMVFRLLILLILISLNFSLNQQPSFAAI